MYKSNGTSSYRVPGGVRICTAVISCALYETAVPYIEQQTGDSTVVHVQTIILLLCDCTAVALTVPVSIHPYSSNFVSQFSTVSAVVDSICLLTTERIFGMPLNSCMYAP